MDCLEVRSLISEYTLGLVSGRRETEIEQHVSSCPPCRAEIARLEKLTLLLEGLEEREPPAGLWNGVYNRIADPQAERRPGIWGQTRDLLRRRVAALSVGLAAVALAAVMMFARVDGPETPSVSYRGTYFQSHMTFASREVLADQAALNSVITLSEREEWESGRL